MSTDLKYIFGWADPQDILWRSLGGEAHIITQLSSGMASLTAQGQLTWGEPWMERNNPWFHSNLWHKWKATRVKILQTAGDDLRLGSFSQVSWGHTSAGEEK